MSYSHITTFERGSIAAYLENGYSCRKIADLLHRHHSSIAREINRNGLEEYKPETAQELYLLHRKNSVPKGKYGEILAQEITDKLNETWSPEQIANTITLGKVSFKTIYNWIYNGKIVKGNLEVLRQKGKRHQPAEARGKFTVGESIHKRPKEIKKREVFGHWELDSMVSSRGESKGCFATFVERKSRLYTALKTRDRTAESMETAIKKLHSILPKNAFKSGTVDRGKEFACYDKIKKALNLTLYFADPYCSWQRGSNENSNGLLREFYPKKTDLAKVNQKELTHNLFLINSRPRKCLGWKSPIQVFLYEVSHLT